MILAVLNLCPFLFCFIVVKNRKLLNDPGTINKFGALYSGLDSKNQRVMSYSIVYLLRRSLFVAITFALFEKPGVQLQFMIFMTIMYLAYLGYADFYITSRGKTLEMLNESVFVLIQYCFVLLYELVSNDYARDVLGNLVIIFTSFLLAINLLVVIVCSVRPCLRKCYLNSLKKKAQAKGLELRR